MICIDNIDNNKNIINISINNINNFINFISDYYTYSIFFKNRIENIIHELRYSLSYVKSKLPYEFIEKIIGIISYIDNSHIVNLLFNDTEINIYFEETYNYNPIYKYIPFSKMNKIYKYKDIIYDFFYKIFSVINNKYENINIRIIYNNNKKLN